MTNFITRYNPSITMQNKTFKNPAKMAQDFYLRVFAENSCIDCALSFHCDRAVLNSSNFEKSFTVQNYGTFKNPAKMARDFYLRVFSRKLTHSRMREPRTNATIPETDVSLIVAF
ncbi:MAG: hypothetical protein IJ191_00185 [Treponema sp.]|nr:hypothetical protein [Treponema sp.]